MSAPIQSLPAPLSSPGPAERPEILRRFLLRSLPPLLLALLFAAWGLRGAATSEFTQADAARHAMNGVLIHDWLVSGQILHPLAFAHRFYSHLPATSIPYHPPLFPAVEALFYLAAGIHSWSARLAIAFLTFVAAVLLYHLVLATHGSRGFAALCVIITFLIPEFQRQSSDVMLEMPALACILGALWFLRRYGDHPTLRHAVLFALLAAAAIWTKQHAVFLIAVPFLLLAFQRNWRAFRQPPLWVATLLIAVAAAAIVGLAMEVHAGGNSEWGSFGVTTPFGNFAEYARKLAIENGVLPALILGAGALLVVAHAAVGREPDRNALYTAWIVPCVGLALVLPFIDERYLFNAYAPAVVLVCDALRRAIRGRSVRRLASVLAVPVLAFAWARPAGYAHGPRQAAALVMAANPARILYCGGNKNGDFIFAVRERDTHLRTIVIRGDKLPPPLFAPAAFEKFVRDYGVNFVLFERRRDPRPWDALTARPTPSMLLVAAIPLSSSESQDNGQILVYRLLHPAAHPRNFIEYESDMVKSGLGVSF